MFWCRNDMLLLLPLLLLITVNGAESHLANQHPAPAFSLYNEAICSDVKETELFRELAINHVLVQPDRMWWARLKTVFMNGIEKAKKRADIVEALEHSANANNFFQDQNAVKALQEFKELTGNEIRPLMLAAILKQFADNFVERVEKCANSETHTIMNAFANILIALDTKLSSFMSPLSSNYDQELSNLLSQPLQAFSKILVNKFYLLSKLDSTEKKKVCAAFKYFVQMRLQSIGKNLVIQPTEEKEKKVLKQALLRCQLDINYSFN